MSKTTFCLNFTTSLLFTSSYVDRWTIKCKQDVMSSTVDPVPVLRGPALGGAHFTAQLLYHASFSWAAAHVEMSSSPDIRNKF